MPVGGRSLIRRTLEAFDRCPEITGITLLISQRNLLEVTRELESDGWRKAIDIHLGGERRQDSVRLGLLSLKEDPPDFVVVHDGARPLVSDDLIHAGLEAARQHGAATAAIPVHHTYKHVDSAGRERIVVEDDAELIEKLGKLVKVFFGSSRNLKVATRDDALMVEALLAADPLLV